MMTNEKTIEDLEKQIKITHASLRSLQDEREALQVQLILEKQRHLTDLAEKMHSCFCGYNHTDGCGWGYEEGANKWGSWSHSRWLNHTENLVKKFGLEKIQGFVDHVIETKREYPDFLLFVNQFGHPPL